MNHRECFADEEELNVYLDGELQGSRKSALDGHVKSCRDCFLRLEIARQLKSAVRDSMDDVKAPAWLRERISTRIREEAPAVSPFWERLINLVKSRPLVPIGAAAVMVAVLLIAVFSRPTSSVTMPLVTEMVHEHYEYLEGITGFGIKSDNYEEISDWLRENAKIEFALSADSESPSLSGACLLHEDGKDIGYVGLQYSDKKVSLFLIKDTSDEIFGPKQMNIGNVSVYCGTCTGMNYVIWQGSGMMNVLVGDVSEESLVSIAGHLI